MDNNYNTYYHQPCKPPVGMLPVPPWEKKRIRSVLSGTAWMVIISQVLIAILANCLYLILYVGTDTTPRLDGDGNIIITPKVVVYGSLSVTAALIICTLIYNSYTHKKLKDLFNTEMLTARKLLITVLAALGAAQLTYLLNMFLSMIFSAAGYEYSSGVADPDTAAGWALEIFTTIITAPLFEEIFYRGVIMRNLARVNKHFAVIVSSLIFGLVHGNPYQFLLGFGVGLVFGYADMKMNSLIPSILAHFAINSHTFITYAFEGLPENTIFILDCTVMMVFFIAGVIALVYALKKYDLQPLPKTPYSRKRTWPILVTSVPFWVISVILVFSMLSSITPIE